MRTRSDIRNPFVSTLRGITFVAALLAALFPMGVSAVEYPAGDVAPHGNFDGQLNAAHVFLLHRFIFR